MNILREICTPQDGQISIRIPKEYSQKQFEVIVIPMEERVVSKKDKLIAALNKTKGKNLFMNIENPTKWQKQLRDEWE